MGWANYKLPQRFPERKKAGSEWSTPKGSTFTARFSYCPNEVASCWVLEDFYHNSVWKKGKAVTMTAFLLDATSMSRALSRLSLWGFLFRPP
jgi:hypothetical protein